MFRGCRAARLDHSTREEVDQMTGESKLGLGLIALLALCCAGPLVLSLLATGAVLGAVGAIWAEDRPLLLGSGAIVVALGVWLLARRWPTPARRRAGRDTPVTTRVR